MIRFYEPEALATAILYFNVYINYHLSLALRVSLRVMAGGLLARRYCLRAGSVSDGHIEFL